MKHLPELKLRIFKSNKMDIGHRLHDALLAAQSQDRITYGVYECGKHLEENPDGVMMCILPDNMKDDVALQIHYTLIEAYCWENAISVVKVDSCEKLRELLTIKPSRPLNDNDIVSGRSPRSPCRSDDFNCLLIRYPGVEVSGAEEDVMDYCKMISDLSPLPIVDLDV